MSNLLSTEEYRTTLESMLVNELTMWRRRLCNQKMFVFDFGCFPWHGYLELSFLTDDEPQMTVISRNPDLTAEWRLYDFTATFTSKWPQAESLAHRMQQTYNTAKNKRNIAEAFIIESAKAVKSESVSRILSTYKLAPDFKVQVFHPDDSSHQNYCELI